MNQRSLIGLDLSVRLQHELNTSHRGTTCVTIYLLCSHTCPQLDAAVVELAARQVEPLARFLGVRADHVIDVRWLDLLRVELPQRQLISLSVCWFC